MAPTDPLASDKAAGQCTFEQILRPDGPAELWAGACCTDNAALSLPGAIGLSRISSLLEKGRRRVLRELNDARRRSRNCRSKHPQNEKSPPCCECGVAP